MTARNAVSLTVSALAIAWIVSLSAVEAIASSREVEYEVRVTGSRVNVRARPTTNSDVLFQVTRGETLHLVETAEGWYFVESPNEERGYIHKGLVELVELAPLVRSESSPRPVPITATATPVAAVPAHTFDPEADEIAEAQARSWAEKKRRRGLYKLIGGGAGVVSGFVVMGSSKVAGIGLVGAGSYFLWDGYSDREEAGRRLRWTLLVQMNRDVKGVAYNMSW